MTKSANQRSPRRLRRIAAMAAVALAAHRASAALPNGVAAGDVTADASVLWARSTETGGPVNFQVSTDAAFGSITGSASATPGSALAPVKVPVAGLTPGTQYFYRATDAGGATAAGRFRTAAAPNVTAGLRFGVSGDWRGELAPYPSVKNVPARDLAFFGALGDTIYADYGSPAVTAPVGSADDLSGDGSQDGQKGQVTTLAEYRLKHNEVYAERSGLNTLRDVRQSTPLLSNIDDHEVINDFSGGQVIGAAAGQESRPFFAADVGKRVNESALYRDGIRAFNEFNPIRDDVYAGVSAGRDGDRMNGRAKLYREAGFGRDALVINTDARSFRDAPLADVTNPADPVAVGTFLTNSFFQDRTMLGRQQLDDTKAALSGAQAAGKTWKFVMLPEPAQNLGVVAAGDRYEGYARERNDLLRHIDTNNIENVVFIAADIHGTIVNNLTYENNAPGPGSPEIQTGAWEITTGAVAFDAPFGPTVVGIASGGGLITPGQNAFYNSLPVANDPDDVPNDKDDFVKGIVNSQLSAQGYDSIGLADPLDITGIDATLLQGDYVALHTFGWTEFEIDPLTQRLLVTTYGILPYTEAELNADPSLITARDPFIVSQFSVSPVPEPAGLGALAATGLLLLRRRRVAR